LSPSLSPSPSGNPGTITIQGTGVTDTNLYDDLPDNNYSSSTSLWIGESDVAVWKSRVLINFDLSGIPEGSRISSATLSIWVLQDESSNERTLHVYRVKRANVISQATWNSYSTGNSWTSGGCDDTTNDREGTDIGSVSVSSSLTDGTEVQITLTASKVQEMITGGSFTNNGFLLRVDVESSDAYYYYSTENANTSRRPKLYIEYNEPGSASPSVSVSFSPSPSPSVSVSASPSVSVSASVSLSPSVSAGASPSVSVSASISPSPSVSVSASISPSPSVSVSASPSVSVSVSVSLSPSVSVSASISPSPSVSVSASPSVSVSVSVSLSPSVSVSASISPSPSVSVSASPSVSVSVSVSLSPSVSVSDSISFSPSLSISPSPSPAEYADKYVVRGNTYTSKYSTTGNTYTDKYSTTGNTYIAKYRHFR
jgi:hypothetical protein